MDISEYKKTISVIVRDDKAIGEMAKKFRLKHNKKLRELSKASGYSISYISDLERGIKKWTQDKMEWYEKACIGIKS